MIVGLDTALQNSGLVILDEAGGVAYAGKPFLKADGKTLAYTERIYFLVQWIEIQLAKFGGWEKVEIFAMEDYITNGYAKGYETAELLGNIKYACWDKKVNYCLVHPSKTHKYVVKKRDVPKEETIAYVASKTNFLTAHHPETHSDLADAWVIAKIGELVLNHRKNPSVKDTWEQRWREIVLTDGSGIVTKPGLSCFFK